MNIISVACILFFYVFVVKSHAQSIKNKHSDLPVYFPIDTKYFKRISSNFGIRRHPITKKRSFHKGIDLVARKGVPIHASANGVVEKAAYASGYGNYVILKHKAGLKTLYGHMLLKAVKFGQRVKQGQIIGYVGSTGRSTGPHLHYEIRIAKKSINPMNYWMSVLKKSNNVVLK